MAVTARPHRNASVDAIATLRAVANGDWPVAAEIILDALDGEDGGGPFVRRLALLAVWGVDVDELDHRLEIMGRAMC